MLTLKRFDIDRFLFIRQELPVPAVLPDFVAAFEQSSAVSIGNEKAVLVPLEEEAVLMWFHDTPPF